MATPKVPDIDVTEDQPRFDENGAVEHKPVVWIINRSRSGDMDFSSAEAFGELRTIFEGQVNIFEYDWVIYHLKKTLAAARKGDMLLVSGFSYVNGLAMHYFLERFNEAPCLIWFKGEYKLLSTPEFMK